MKKPYYITTAIAYTSKKPHIGNSYEIVLTDAIARFKRMQGFDVFFLTGTDEHGQKIEECAKECNCSPNEYVDKIANEIREICDLLNTTYDKFIRTTDDYHVKAVQNIFKRLYEQGDIYKSEYEGMYCVPCEGFYTSSQLIDGKCPECRSEVRPTKEEAYFLKLSKYQKQLEEHILKNPDFIYPESRKREMLNNFIKPGLQDLCVSRTSFKWGVPVTFDDKHIIYVWVDALSNYITALGFDAKENSKLYYKYWPADVHVIGKDILRFHTIYWPIILMALGEPLPKQIFGHPWLLMGNDKMSKSKGNVIYADDLVNLFGVDAVRHYLLSEMPHASDGSLTYSSIIERYNSELANTLGNLVNRCVAMVNKYFDGVLNAPKEPKPIDDELKSLALSALPKIAKLMDTYHISDAVDEIFSLARRSNKYIDETTPWILAKDEHKKERLNTVLYNLIESIRFIAVLLSPFMPATSENILSQIGCNINSFNSLNEFGAMPEGQKMGEPVPLFSRLDEKEVLTKIESALGEKQEETADCLEGVSMIGIEDFAKVDLRIAEIIDCKPIKRAKKLLELTLNDGTSAPRTVVSGIARWYSPENLVGRKIILVYNLSPATLCGVVSSGMILAAACGEDDVRVIFADDMPSGAKIS
ncbi:MAG: methionine--tRNA ligase [Clostridiales bacterium]|jgi:methionyl-tRNA synthetase|nr:methionine--tRNA ligase [Clostridiales bacterium]